MKASPQQSVGATNSPENTTQRGKCLIASDRAGTKEECQRFDKEQLAKNENEIKSGLDDFNGDIYAFCYSRRLAHDGQSLVDEATLKFCKDNVWKNKNKDEISVPSASATKTASLLIWPRSSSIQDIKDKIPQLKCFTYQGEDACTAKMDSSQISLLRSQKNPVICTIGKEVTITLSEDVVNGVSCETTEETVQQLSRELLNQNKKSLVQENQIGPMKVMHQEWKVENDYLILSRYSGRDVYGNPLNTFVARISTEPMLPPQD